MGGCAGGLYKSQEYFKAGDPVTAEECIVDYASDPGDENIVIAKIEEGSILFFNGKYGPAADAFQAAEERIERLDESPEYSLSSEAASAATTPESIPYEGTPYDRVLATTYRGLAYGLAGNPDAARAALFNAQFRQKDAIRIRQKQIEEAAEQEEDDRFARGSSTAQDAYGDAFFAGYDVASNSFADAVNAAFRLGQMKDSSDADTARDFLRRVGSINPENGYVGLDIAVAEATSAGSPPDRTYVFFATGYGPYRDEFKIAIPYAVDGGLRTVQAAFPILRRDELNFAQPITIEAGGDRYTVETLADMDRIVGADFKARLRSIIIRHVVSAVGRELIATGARAAGEEIGGVEGALVNIAGAIYKTAQNRADRRSWATLPKYYYYASFETPEDGTLSINDPASGPYSIDVEPGGVNIVHVRATRPGFRFQIANFNVGTSGLRAAADPAAAAESQPSLQEETPDANAR
ncbi:MAG: hypothetical protein AAF108_10900 [Planctomycetota bacterium]